MARCIGKNLLRLKRYMIILKTRILMLVLYRVYFRSRARELLKVVDQVGLVEIYQRSMSHSRGLFRLTIEGDKMIRQPLYERNNVESR